MVIPILQRQLDKNMTLSNMLALLGAMILLALTPDTSVIAVVARSLASGFSHGVVTIIGLLFGDFVFIIIAVYGLSAIAETMSSLFIVLKYLGGGYLIYLGLKLCQAKSKAVTVEEVNELSWLSNFLCGLFITISDPKAILFYISFLPAFLDLSNISRLDIGIIMLNATIAVGGVKLVYAYMADRARILFEKSKVNKAMNIAAGMAMMAIGVILIVKL